VDEIAILADGLVKKFKTPGGWITAVDGLSFQVRRGETFGLIGPDGAGKTTATRLILGLLSRTDGSSQILGFDPLHETYQVRERVGYIAQQFALPADLTVMENMRFFARVQGMSRDEQDKYIPELLAFAGLSNFTARLAGKLSGGMKKKLALACSLVHSPQVVLLDEPTLGVDPVSRREFWNLLGNLRAERGLTIFVCTPYMDEAERCNQIGLIYGGKIIASGTPARIKAMVIGELLELTPARFVPARELVTTLDGVLEVQTYGDKLHIFVDKATKRATQIKAALDAQGIGYDDVRKIEVRMEEAFISLIRRQSESQGEKDVEKE
jgi:ABC-2 type transport system ATP-binding protein